MVSALVGLFFAPKTEVKCYRALGFLLITVD
jgi:hypothetical protein